MNTTPMNATAMEDLSDASEATGRWWYGRVVEVETFDCYAE
ncbi:hypothetical protein [Bradyrhizobium valentinum]|nr:hypothetical protein [Bradyrhizobium valentinum]